MKNKSKGQQKVETKVKTVSVPMPSVINMDDIGTMQDDEIVERIRSLETDRERVLEVRGDPKAWEIECCYARRELQIRRVRHQHHEQYLNHLDREADDAKRQEDSYPVADLDNSAFMFFVN